MNLKEKKARLKELSKEVNDFHPFLLNFFGKLPGIESVHYTHGIHEYGADFILIKTDPTFGTINYSGVVVKTGKIDKSKVTEVNSQISECTTIERMHPIEPYKIYLNEVIVITNEIITENAKVTLKSFNKGVNLALIDSNTLIGLIDNHLENYWTEINYHVSSYLGKLNESIKNIDSASTLSLSTICTESFFVEPTLTEMTESEYRGSKKNYSHRNKINIRDEIEKNNLVLIQSLMGGGKSKLVRELILDYSSPETYIEKHVIPLFTSYKDFYDNYNLDIQKFITSTLPPQILSIVDDRVKYHIYIDGFDEKLIADQTTQYSLITDLYTNISKIDNTSLILTSRNIVSSSDEKKLYLPHVKVVDINPLSSNQLIEFVEKLCTKSNISKRIFNDLKKSVFMKDLSRSPIVAIILAELLNEISEDLPSNITELYTKYLEIILGRWDMEKGLMGQKEYRATDIIIQNISEYLMINGKDSLTHEEFLFYFEDHILGRKFDFTPKELSKKVLNRSGLLFVDPISKTIKFKHRTFVEYYFAKKSDSKSSLTINQDLFTPYWMNTYFFYFGIKKDCPELLQQAIDVDLEHHLLKLMRIINMSNYMLASYTTKTKFLEKTLESTIIEAGTLYKQIKNKKFPDSPLQEIPNVHLLGLMSYLIKENYSYKYFDDIITNAALSISYSDIDEEVKIYSIFMTSIIGIELDNHEPLELFLSEYRKILPTDLKIFLAFESSSIKNQSQKLKGLLKSIRRNLKNVDKDYLKSLTSTS